MKTNLVLLVLALVLAVPTILTARGERARFTEIKDIPLLFDGFNKAAVVGVGIAKGWHEPAGDASQQQQQQQPPQRQIEELQFRREGDRWHLANTDLKSAPVRSGMIEDQVLEHLGRIRRDERAVHRAKATPEELKQYGLTKEDGYLIVAFDAQNRVLAELVVGKDVSGGEWEGGRLRGRYVRARGNESVLIYEVDHFIPSVTATEWIDTRMFQAELNKLVGFSLYNATVKEPVSFRKERPEYVEWKVDQAPPDTGAPIQGDLQQLIQKVSIVTAARFLTPMVPEMLRAKGLELNKIGLEPADVVATFTLDTGETLTLELGRKLDDQPEVYARTNKSLFLITVPDWMKADLEVDIKRRLLAPSAEVLKEDKDAKDNKDGKDDKDKKGTTGK
jgi:hypothetical protein